jgi:hypothetical protein
MGIYHFLLKYSSWRHLCMNVFMWDAKELLRFDSDDKKFRPSLFWVAIHLMLVVVYRRFGSVYRCNFHGSRLRLLDSWKWKSCSSRNVFKELTNNLMFCWSCIRVHIYRYSETNVMHFLLNFLRIKGLYTFRALLAHLQQALHKRHLVYCVRVMSVGCTRIKVAANCHNTHAIY